jgi:5'-nucleotidase/UDP-sugar diphosphatase
MKKTNLLLIIILGIIITFASCKPEEEVDPNVVGQIEVALDANKTIVRTQECLAGNLVADAIKDYGVFLGKTVDFAVFNGGGIRFDAETRADGIYPAGDFTYDDAEEMFPFGNTLMIVEVTGEQLKSIFERSVASLPAGEGNFLQISSEVKITIDTLLAAQVVNKTDSTLTSEGLRIKSIKINNVEYNPASTYKIITSDFIGGGGDFFIALKNLETSKRTSLDSLCQKAIIYYIKENTPVTPVLGSRIVFE